MAERVGSEKIQREEGWLYYLGADGYTYRKNKKSGETEKVGSEKINREDGYLYYINRSGYAVRVKMGKVEAQKQAQIVAKTNTGNWFSSVKTVEWAAGFVVGLILGLPFSWGFFRNVLTFAVIMSIIYGIWALKFSKMKGRGVRFVDGFLVITCGLLVPVIERMAIESNLGSVWKKV